MKMSSLAITLVTALPSITTAQTITPAPLRPLLPRHPRPDPEPQTSIGTSDPFASCYSSVPGCSEQLTLFDECTSSYGTAFKYLYCLCTNGYYDAYHSCDACLVKFGVYSTAFLSTELSLDNVNCAMDSAQFGPGTSTLTGFDGITFGGGASTLTGSNGVTFGSNATTLTGSIGVTLESGSTGAEAPVTLSGFPGTDSSLLSG